jgi:hypothetical protein
MHICMILLSSHFCKYNLWMKIVYELCYVRSLANYCRIMIKESSLSLAPPIHLLFCLNRGVKNFKWNNVSEISRQVSKSRRLYSSNIDKLHFEIMCDLIVLPFTHPSTSLVIFLFGGRHWYSFPPQLIVHAYGILWPVANFNWHFLLV